MGFKCYCDACGKEIKNTNDCNQDDFTFALRCYHIDFCVAGEIYEQILNLNNNNDCSFGCVLCPECHRIIINAIQEGKLKTLKEE